MSRFYVPREAVKGGKICVSGQEAHHIANVMRLREKDEVVVFDGTGKEYKGIIEEIKSGNLIIGVISTTDDLRLSAKRSEASPKGTTYDLQITLAQALPKKGKMDYIIEKSTELGVQNIVPLETKRTIVRLKNERRAARLERWRRIACEASKQCGRLRVPGVENISTLGEVLKRIGEYDLAMMACLEDGADDIKRTLKANNPKNIIVFIGPEGDFTKDEIALAKSSGVRLISLGKRVLKSDTAGLAAISMINYEYAPSPYPLPPKGEEEKGEGGQNEYGNH